MRPSDDLIVSNVEPSGLNRKKVWMQKGKNLFNVNQLNVLLVNNASYSVQNNEIIVTSNGDYSRIELLVKLEVGKTYFLSTNVTNSIIGRANISIFSLGYTQKYAEQYMFDANGTIGLLFTPEEENIIIVLYSNASSDNTTNTVNFSNIQIEQGSTATSYEAYIEPEIYVRNDNNVYEKLVKQEKILHTAVFEREFNNVPTQTNVEFNEMFPGLNLNDIICFNVEITNTYSTWDRIYAHVLRSTGTLQVRSYAETQDLLAVRVTAFYK